MHVYAICVIFLLNMWTVFSSQTTLTLCFEVGTTSGLGEQPAAIARARTGCLHRPDFHVYGIFEEYNSQPTDRAYIDSDRYLPRAQSAPARFLSFREHWQWYCSNKAQQQQQTSTTTKKTTTTTATATTAVTAMPPKCQFMHCDAVCITRAIFFVPLLTLRFFWIPPWPYFRIQFPSTAQGYLSEGLPALPSATVSLKPVGSWPGGARHRVFRLNYATS